MKVYKHIAKKEVVYEDDAEAYAMDQLGITIKPKDKDGTYTQEQIDFLGEFTEWYFSDWVLENEEDDIPNLEKELFLTDRRYEFELERKWGLV